MPRVLGVTGTDGGPLGATAKHMLDQRKSLGCEILEHLSHPCRLIYMVGQDIGMIERQVSPTEAGR